MFNQNNTCNDKTCNLNKNNFIYLDNIEISSYKIDNQDTENVYEKKDVEGEYEKVETPTLVKKISKSKYKNIYCVNCGEKGHVVRDCDGPITSFGIIAFKVVEDTKEEMFDKDYKIENILNLSKLSNKVKEVYPKIKMLMIQRKDTMGFTDFVRGKYPDNKEESAKILPIFLNEMTKNEKQILLSKTFNEIWNKLWVNHESKCFKNEYEFAYKKYKKLNIPELLNSSMSSFDYQEFGFPKGRRNMKETNIACAEREFYEETGYDKNSYEFIKNYPLIHEEFLGTNGIKYRHIYYLVKMKKGVPPPKIDYKNKIQTGEVRNITWLSYNECLSVIRPYDIEKKNVIEKVYNDIINMNSNYLCSRYYYNTLYKKKYNLFKPINF